jgi:hypothetical protein
MAIESVEVRVLCDECGADEVVEVGSLVFVETHLRNELEALDWTAQGNRHLCDRCSSVWTEEGDA